MTRPTVLIASALSALIACCAPSDEDSAAEPESAPAETGGDRATQKTAPAPESAGGPSGLPSSQGFAGDVVLKPPRTIVRRPEDDITIRHRKAVRSIMFGIPNGWMPESPPPDADWLSQIRIPAPFETDSGDGFVNVFDGNDEGLFEVFNRWLAQLRDLAVAPEVTDLEYADGTPLLVTEFSGVGTYDPGEGIEPRAEMMILGVLIEGGPEGSLIIKAVGPRSLMEEQRYRWDVLLRSLRIYERRRP